MKKENKMEYTFKTKYNIGDVIGFFIGKHGIGIISEIVINNRGIYYIVEGSILPPVKESEVLTLYTKSLE